MTRKYGLNYVVTELRVVDTTVVGVDSVCDSPLRTKSSLDEANRTPVGPARSGLTGKTTTNNNARRLTTQEITSIAHCPGKYWLLALIRHTLLRYQSAKRMFPSSGCRQGGSGGGGGGGGPSSHRHQSTTPEWTADRLCRASYQDIEESETLLIQRFKRHLLKRCRSGIYALLIDQSQTTRDFSLEVDAFDLLEDDPVLGQ